jgi:putative heme-binding domain-containing protein
MSVVRSLLLVCLLTLIASTTVLGQHVFTAAELADGGRMYQSACAGCHGQEGDAISGANLMTGTFRRASEDEELIDLIRLGIPDTGMPPNAVSTEEAGTILAYLRAVPNLGGVVDASAGGDPVLGRGLFETRGCMNCHRVNGEGGRRGPDLSRVARVAEGGGRFFVAPTAEEIRQRIETSIVDPNAEIAASNRTFRVVPVGGTPVTGRLLNHDTHTLAVLVDGDRVETFELADLAEYGITDSPMPSFRDRLSSEELANLVSYLTTLSGG